ncbi:MAG: ABC transporter ATP-binding protein [Dehalococcoidia bacterium]|nr:ABC transporter ATP-binding protein [Dehalococcoidia bacterium]
MSTLVQLNDVQVSQDGRLIIDISELAVEKGEILVIIGPNGVGKSTLLRVLSLLQKPSRGQVLLEGQAINHRRKLLSYRRRLALVMQQPLLRDVSTFDNVATGLRFRWTSKQEIRNKVEHWLSCLGISHLAARHASTLSGGEAQRASLARALVLEPDLLLLDEPFADLDPPTREGLMAELKPILRETGTTTVFVTHDRDEALRLGDRLAVMIHGRIIQVGRPQEVLARPASQEVAAFVGTATVLSGVVVEERQGLLAVEVATDKRVAAVGQVPVGSRVLVCLRPEEVTLLKATQAGLSSARNHFPGVVQEVTDLGYFLRVSLDCGFPLVAYATRVSVSEMGITVGQPIVASFKATAVHLIPQ